MGKKERKPVPNVSGTFQVSSDKQQKDLKDLEAIKLKALEEGMAYQTLIARVLHRYVNR